MDEKDNSFDERATVNSPSAPTHEDPGVPNRLEYDSFMYEPLGFEELDRALAEEAAQEAEIKRKLRKKRILIWSLVAVICVAIFITVYNIASLLSPFGKNSLGGKNSVVLYREKKPEGAAEAETLKDESGRYTTIGIPTVVRPSVVEIYTYSDSAYTTPIGSGSGIILSEDGYILTNEHVLKSDGYHVVITSDDKRYNAKIIGRDAKTDLAVVKVTAQGLTPAVLGDSDETVVGEQVMAIGNPAGLSGTVTDGIVSAVGRKIKSVSTGFEMNCIQTNADISPGNSGGALVNMYGQVIGVTSSKYVSSSYEGLGFAIAINDAMPIVEELISNGYIAGRFRIGIELIGTKTDAQRASVEEELGYTLPDDFYGIYIVNIDESFDIFNTELKPGDFIISVNGKTVKDYSDFYDTISSQYSAGDKVPAKCAHLDDEGNISFYDIKFELKEDTSGDF